MSYVYIRSEPDLWTVGFYDPSGEWHADSDFEESEKAAERAAKLNGGAATPNPSHAILVAEVVRLRDILLKLTTAASGAIPFLIDHVAMTPESGPGDRIALDRLDDALTLARNYQAETWAQQVKDNPPTRVVRPVDGPRANAVEKPGLNTVKH